MFYGTFILSDIETDKETDKKGCRVVWMYSYCRDADTNTDYHWFCAVGICFPLSVFMSVSASGSANISSLLETAERWRECCQPQSVLLFNK